MNYHQTDDFVVNLEHVYKIMGFANKGNAKRTLENNFTKDEDYKITFLPLEKGQITLKDNVDLATSPNGEAGLFPKNLGGAGLNKEDIMLNVDTFKNLCMLVKTPKGCMQLNIYYTTLHNFFLI